MDAARRADAGDEAQYKFDSRFLDDMLPRVVGYGLHLCGQGDDRHPHALQRGAGARGSGSRGMRRK